MGLFDWLFGKKAPAPAPAGHDIELPADPKPTGPAKGPSDQLVAFIQRQEGLELTARPDVDGVLILGYGCKVIDGKPVVKGQTIDQPNATRNLKVKMQQCSNAVLGVVKRPLTQGQLDALTDFVYNAGIGALQSSTILKTINTTGTSAVTQDMFTRWNKIHDPATGEVKELDGLTARRKLEYQFFTTP